MLGFGLAFRPVASLHWLAGSGSRGGAQRHRLRAYLLAPLVLALSSIPALDSLFAQTGGGTHKLNIGRGLRQRRPDFYMAEVRGFMLLQQVRMGSTTWIPS